LTPLPKILQHATHRKFLERAALVVGLACAVMASGAAAAESTLRFSLPENFGSVPAVTYDAAGLRIGTATTSLERSGLAEIRITGSATLDRGGSTKVHADFRVRDDGTGILLLRQQSQSITVDGRPLGTLFIDHEAGFATCTPPPDSGREVQRLPIPEPDRAANVPLYLLFEPLAAGTSESVEFDLLICRDDPRFMAFEARAVSRTEDGAAPPHVEIRYAPRFGAVLNFLARAVVPDLRFWLDTEHADRYLAHRMPLYAKGPEIWVIREGIDPGELSGGKGPPVSPQRATGEPLDEDRSHAAGG
jgi:hypothetical protein